MYRMCTLVFRLFYFRRERVGGERRDTSARRRVVHVSRGRGAPDEPRRRGRNDVGAGAAGGSQDAAAAVRVPKEVGAAGPHERGGASSRCVILRPMRIRPVKFCDSLVHCTKR